MSDQVFAVSAVLAAVSIAAAPACGGTHGSSSGEGAGATGDTAGGGSGLGGFGGSGGQAGAGGEGVPSACALADHYCDGSVLRRCEDDAPVLDCALCVYDARYDVFDTECRDATYDFARLHGHYVPACWYDTGEDSSVSLCGVGDTPLPPPPSACDLDDVYCQGETLRACADGAAVLDCRTCAAADGAHSSCIDAAWSYGTFRGRLTAGCYTIETTETSTTLHSECFPDGGSGGSAGSGGSGGGGGSAGSGGGGGSGGTAGCDFDTDCGYHEACVGGDCEYVDCTNDAQCSDCYRCGDDNRCRYCGEGPFGCYC